MVSESPRLTDLVTVLYRPRETIRRILDSPRRWSAEVIVLASVCASVGDKDSSSMNVARVPGIGLSGTLALTVFGIIATAVAWVVCGYLFAWIVAVAGRRIGGVGATADVRAALSWSLVPLVWSVLYRIPVAIYARRFAVFSNAEATDVFFEFVRQGGCTLAVIVFAINLGLFIWTILIAGSGVGEALRLSTLQGLGALAIAAAAPLVIGIAAALALNT